MGNLGIFQEFIPLQHTQLILQGSNAASSPSEEEKYFGCLVTFRFSTFATLFSATAQCR